MAPTPTPTSSPPKPRPPTHANRVAELVLDSCRLKDPSAHIASVLRDSEGRTVVRVRADPRNNPLDLLRAVKQLWPLATSSVHENALDGIVECEVVVPRQSDEELRALKRAKRSRVAELLLTLAVSTLVIAIAVYANDCYLKFTNATSPEP